MTRLSNPGRQRRAARRSSRLVLGSLLLSLALHTAAAADYIHVPGGRLNSVLASESEKGPAPISAFEMRVTPVTQGEFRDFVAVHPPWQRDRVARTFADAAYLQDWSAPLLLSSAAAPSQPVTHVSWFAAQAFCEAEGARLPSWLEWEYVAAADATRADARSDPAWRARILGWYARPASSAPPPVGGEANFYGVRDMHGLVWEWVDDFSALLVSPDSRSQDDPDKLQFCGAGAINLQDRENYAVLMRIALLSALNAADSTGSLGFRCVRPSTE